MKKDKNPLWRRILKAMGIVVGSIAGICLALFLILLSWSPGKIEPYYDENGEILADSIAEITKVEIGSMEQGMQVSYELSRQYFDVLKAPEKHFYQFDDSAHSPFIEEPEKFIQILKDALLR